MPKWVNVPNALTFFRLILVLIMPILFYTDHLFWAMAVYIIAFLTDFLDGFIARKYHLVTDIGKLLDPLADKLMLIVTLLEFCLFRMLPWYIFILATVKEMIMIIGGIILYEHRTVVFANIFGKIATGIFTLAVVLTFLSQWVRPVHLVIMLIALAMSYISMIIYFIQFVLSKHPDKG